MFTTSPATIPSPCSGRALQGHDGLARVDPHPDLKLERRLPLVQLRDRLQDPKPRPDRALGIVLVSDRRTEHRHHRIADELLDRPSVALELAAETRVIRADASAHILRISGLRRRREPDQVTEQHRHHLPLLEGDSGALS